MVFKPRDPPGHSCVGMQWLGKIFLSIIIAIAAGSAPVKWPEIDRGTCLLKSAVALQRSQYQVSERLHQGKRRRCKTPHHHRTNRLVHQQQQLPPPRRRRKRKTCVSECHRSGKPLPPQPLGEPERVREKKIGRNSPSRRNFWQSSGYGYEHTIFRFSVGRAGYKLGVPLIPPLSRHLDRFSRSTTFLGKLSTRRTNFLTIVGSVPTSKKNLTHLTNIKLYNQTSSRPRRKTPRIATTAVKSSSPTTTTSTGTIRLELTTRRHVNTQRTTTRQYRPTTPYHLITWVIPRKGPSVYRSSRMGKSKKPSQTPKDRERGYEALYRSVGLSSEEEGDGNESDSEEESRSGSSSEEGPTTPKRGKGTITAESPQQRDGGSKGKRVARKPPDPSSSVPYATGIAASIAPTPWNKQGTFPVDAQTSTFGTGEYPPLPARLVGMETDLVILRPAAKTRSEHAVSSQARARSPTVSPAITSETPPANPYERPGRRIVVNESANTMYTPEDTIWDGWDSDLDRGSDEDQDGDYRKGLQGTLERSEEYETESQGNTLTTDPIMRAQAVEARRLARLARD